MTRHRRRVGFIVPSSNTVFEDSLWRSGLAAQGVSAHVSRVQVRTISADAESLDQFNRTAMIEAAQRVADAGVDLIIWAGTAASWLGFARDSDLADDITARTGVAATTTLLEINRRLADLGARRIGLVTPYVADLEARIIANYAEIGIEVVAAERLDLTVNTDFAQVAPQVIAAMVERVASSGCDAVTVTCTNFAGADIAAAMAAHNSTPVIDSVAATIERCRSTRKSARSRFLDAEPGSDSDAD